MLENKLTQKNKLTQDTDPQNEDESDDVLLAFSAARDAAPEDRELLRQWTDRFPQFADDLIAVDFARFAVGMRLSDPLEDGLGAAAEDPATVALGLQLLAARRGLPSAAADKPPLTSLVEDAKARGLDVQNFAEALRLDRLLLTRLERRLLDAATLPLTLVRRLGETLDRTEAEIAAYLRGGQRLAASGHYRSRRAPSLESAGSPMSFREALDAGQSLGDDDRAYWQGEADAGVLGEI